MSVLFSRACEYGMRALVEMARDQEQPIHLAQELAERLDIPAPFLAKTLQLLVKKDILHSTKGRSGGFSFARPASKIRLLEVVEAIDGLGLAEDCVLGMPLCGDSKPCSVHYGWAPIRKAIVQMLKTKTIKSLAVDSSK
jgi:Rrf2 family protein